MANVQDLYYMTGQKPVIVLAFANEQADNVRYLRQLNQELREIKQALREVKQKNRCQIEILAGATLEDILQTFRDYKNQIAVFHYGGHADGFQLLLESEKGNEIAHGEGFANILAELPALELVFLNGCSTQQYAQKITQTYPISVIATENEVDDEVARLFAVHFYQNLALGNTYFQAYQTAENILQTKKGSANFRALYRKNYEPKSEFPWKFGYKDTFYHIKNWTLITETMNNQEFAKQTRRLLAQKPEKAIEQIIDFLEEDEKDEDLLNEMIMQQTAWNDLAKQIRQSAISFENANLKKGQIIRSVTEILKSIKNLSDIEPTPMPEPNDEVAKLWQEKLQFLQQEYALATGAQKFTLKKQIEEAETTLTKIWGNKKNPEPVPSPDFDVKNLKKILKEYVNQGELSELFEEIEDNENFLKYDKSQFHSLKNRVIDGENSTSFKQQLKVFVGTLKVK